MRATSRIFAVQLAVLALCVLLMRTQWNTLYDFVVAIDHGDVLFGDFVFHYYPTVHFNRHEGPPAGGFFYPAGFAALIAPLGMFELETAMILWAILLLGCILFLATRLVRAVADGNAKLAVLGTILVVTSVPVLHDLKWGQVSLPILVAAGGAILLRERGRLWPAAALIGVCAGIKGYPLVLLAWFLVKGDFRFVWRATLACFFTLVILPASVLGPEHALLFQTVSSNAVLGASDGVLRDFNSQYGPVVIARAIYGLGAWDRVDFRQEYMSLLACFACIVAIVALAIVAARSTSPTLAKRRDWIGLVLVFSSVPFWLKTSWTHYFVHLPLAHTMLTGILLERHAPFRATRGLALVLFVAPSVFLASLFGLASYANREGWLFYASDGSLFFANLFVLFALAMVIVEAHTREGGPLLARGAEGRTRGRAGRAGFRGSAFGGRRRDETAGAPLAQRAARAAVIAAIASRMAPGSNGLSMIGRPVAASRSASRSTPPEANTNRSASSGQRCWTASWSSRPLISGMRTSQRMASNDACSSITSSASAPLPTVTTS